MNILTVTPNPAIDQTITLDRLTPGQVHRARSVRYNAGGKGVNVSSCLADWSLPSAATGFLGRENGAIFEKLCRDKGLEDHFIRLSGLSRTNIKVVAENDTTDINLPGAEVTAADLAELESLVDRFKTAPGLAVLAGSLPPGCPASIYRGLTARLHGWGGRVLVDAEGPALAEALKGERPPFAVKPNRQELSQWAGRPLKTLTDVAEQARALRNLGIGLVVVSLGEEGALFVDARQILWAGGRAEEIVSTVGAGDAMVAGLAAGLAEEGDLERLARLSTAFSLAKLSLLGPNLPPRAEVESRAARVEIKKV